MATVPASESSYSGTSTSAATSVHFADRYQFVNVVNTGSTTLYVTGDGSTPTDSGAGTAVAVMPGDSALISNGLPIWHQSELDIPGSPADPGVTITLVGESTYTLEGA